MSWQCPECGSINDGSLLRCDCGRVLDIPLDDGPGTQLQKRESSETTIDITLPQTELASTGQRLGNMFLDSIFNLIIIFVIGFMAVVTAPLLGLRNSFKGMNDYLPGIIISFLYYFPQEAFSGRTLGKMITGTKAVNEDGTKLTFGRALGRTLCRYIPFEAFSFLGGNGRPRGWHDRISRTKVISIKKSEQGSSTVGYLSSLHNRCLSSVVNHSFKMFTRPVYIFSWIALIGLSILRLIKWPIPFIGPPLEFLLLIQIFCGIISANIAKRKGKSALLWFFIGLIPIGISFLFALQFLCFIIFPIITGGEL